MESQGLSSEADYYQWTFYLYSILCLAAGGVTMMKLSKLFLGFFILSGVACGSSDDNSEGNSEGSATREVTGRITPSALNTLIKSNIRAAVDSCSEASLCCWGYTSSSPAVVSLSGTDECTFSIDLPLENYCFCGFFSGADAVDNSTGEDGADGCPDDYADVTLAPIPVFQDADGTIEAFELGSCTGIFCSNQDILTEVDEDNDGLSNTDDDNDDGDDLDDTDDLCNAGGCGNPVQRDGDGNSIPDFFEGIYGSLTDTDDDGIPNEFDIDIDGDGIFNASDADDDADGTDDADDDDADGDGISAAYESDSDRDGIPNFLDLDIDGDNTINDNDTDSDGDDILDVDDLDSNGDGIADAFESDTDDDGDGIPDFIDEVVEGANADDTRLVSGAVADSAGNGLPGLTVILYEKLLNGTTELGVALTDSGGNYSILYESEDFIDLLIRIYDEDGTQLAESNVQYDSDDDENIDLTF